MSQTTIACCLCGSQIIPNDVAMCIQCLQLQIGASQIIDPLNELCQCKKCERWHVRQDQWQHHEIESSGLLALCLKKINGLNKVKLLDAVWIWTEPHSKRIKVAIDIERSVVDDKMNIKQKVVVEFIVKNKQCMECIRDATDHTWVALIQLRHRVGHKKSLYALEDLLTKTNMHTLMTAVEVVREGIDFYFKSKGHAERVMDLISSHLPIRCKHSKKLVSQDNHSNSQKIEYTTIVEVAPVSKNDLVIVPKDSGRPAQLMLVSKVSSSLHLIDPFTLSHVDIPSSKYFAKPFLAVQSSTQLASFLVLDIDPVSREAKREGVELSGVLADAEVLREMPEDSESGSGLHMEESPVHTRTHLGHILRPGDSVLGYDLRHAVLSDTDAAVLARMGLPDVVLVRRVEAARRGATRTRTRKQREPWLVPGLKKGRGGDEAGEEEEAEYQTYLDDLEPDGGGGAGSDNDADEKEERLSSDGGKGASDNDSEEGKMDFLPPLPPASP